MPSPPLLPALHRSTAALLRGLDAEQWTDADLAAPSLCEGWTRGHVLTHLARNADGIAATLEGALRGEIVERYPDGWDARNRAIDDGAGRPLAEQLDDLRTSAYRLDRALTDIGDVDGWDLPSAEGKVAGEWVWPRFREVEIHRVDLDGSYGADDWPQELVHEQLRQALATLPSRIGAAVRVSIGAAGSTVPELGDNEITVGEGEPVVVRGPDWAVLAWLIGRPAAARGALTATPELGAWR